MKSLILTLLLVSANAYSIDVKIPKEQCSDVDIRDKMSPELKAHFSEPQNQDGVGWCYAFAAADLMSAETNKPLSSTHVSAIFNKGVDENFFLRTGYKIGKLFTGGAFDTSYEGGWIDWAIEDSSEAVYVCTEEALPFDRNRYGETARIINALEDIKKDIDNEEMTNICSRIEVIRNKSFENLKVEEIYRILEEDNLNRALSDIIKKNCKGHMVKVDEYDVKTIRRPSIRNRKNESPFSARKRAKKKVLKNFEKIDEVLKKGRPLGVSYNVKHVMKQKGLHASVVTARRWKNGKCQFKIRNSWGRSCASYDRKEIEECNYEEGSFWVSDQKFIDLADTLDYISN
ncbi:hypothetical protein [Halobacteriovorax marinus]|uniref:hypothetical protein n=1 Tax=Halobacteriovorax marinus TaxID=97084 RepID=UPI003A8FF1FC